MNVLFWVKILWDLNSGQVILLKRSLQTTICGRHEINIQIWGQPGAHYKDEEKKAERFADNSHVTEWNNNNLDILGRVKHIEIIFVCFFSFFHVRTQGSEVKAWWVIQPGWILHSPLKTPQSRLDCPQFTDEETMVQGENSHGHSVCYWAQANTDSQEQLWL